MPKWRQTACESPVDGLIKPSWSGEVYIEAGEKRGALNEARSHEHAQSTLCPREVINARQPTRVTSPIGRNYG